MSSGTLVQAEQLENFVHALFVHAGMAPEPARDVAKALLWAELRGIDTHGVGRVGFYLNFIQKGVINTQATWQVLHDTPAVQVFDANASAGAVAMFHAVTQAALKARAGNGIRIENILGDSPKIRDLRQLIQTVAPTDATVLILGESGTGKELIAGAIHFHSRRAAAHYVRLNCAAIPETLLESELFGYERGAFTGAHRTKRGYVEEADGGTIFLDEIGDMSRPLQAKLLRFLEDGSFTRVGGTQELRVQVRLIAATNRNIVDAIKKGEFREDLFHRLNVMQFRPPPLRERGTDIALLARNFLRVFALKLGRTVKDISPLAMLALQAHSWPGNVRELRNVIERAVILEPSEFIQPASLPDFEVESRLRDGPVEKSASSRRGSLPEALLRFEKEMILDALEASDGSLSKAAAGLDLSRHSLRYRMGRLGLGVDGGVDEDADTGTGSPVR